MACLAVECGDDVARLIFGRLRSGREPLAGWGPAGCSFAVYIALQLTPMANLR